MAADPLAWREEGKTARKRKKDLMFIKLGLVPRPFTYWDVISPLSCEEGVIPISEVRKQASGDWLEAVSGW